MNEGPVPAALSEAALPPLMLLANAPLVVKTTTIRCKVRPEAWAWLDQAAREVNQVWNFANATARKALNPYAGKGKWLTGFDLNNLVAGCGEAFDRIGSDVAQKVCGEFGQKRSQFKKPWLRFRASGGSKRALGWIPFKAVNVRQKGNSLTFCGKRIRLFNLGYYLGHRKAALKLKEGSFAQNALGEWFLNQPMDIAFVSLPPLQEGTAVGMDLGKDIALSTGEKLAYAFYREVKRKLAKLQRHGHKKQAKHLNSDLKNQRLNQQHQDTTRLVREHGAFYLGDNSGDNAIGKFKTLLRYKGHWAGRKVILVSERFTTQVCSNCGHKTGPRGLRQLGVRAWQCRDCEAWHDRDINAALNMLTAAVSRKNAAFQPRSGLPFAGTR